MEIKQKPPTDRDVAEAMGPSLLRGMLPAFRQMQTVNSWAEREAAATGRRLSIGTTSKHRDADRLWSASFKRTACTFDDHRNAATPCEPVAVHGECE